MTRDRSALAAVVALMAGAVAHVALLGSWLVEDAAISFAYARHWAQGHGLVPFVGGERVEGYSNFAWVVLLAVGERLGADAFTSARLLSMALTAATVPVVWQLGRRAAPERPELAGLTAAALFAASTQTAIFGAAGLENPLLGFLLASGLLVAAHEAEDRTAPPWSALVFLGVALCRPEGAAYAFVGGLLRTVAELRADRGVRRTLVWWALFLAPFAAYHAGRYAYFAWPFPMTFYAKVHGTAGSRLDWAGRGWRYLRGFVWESGAFAALPLLAAALLGRHRLGRPVGVGLAALGLSLALLPLPSALGTVRTLGLPVVGVGLGCLAIGAPGWAVRVPAFACVAFAAAFAVYAEGDWMSGYRWLAVAVPPGAVLVGAGLADLTRVLGPRHGWAGGGLAALGVAAFAVTNLRYTLGFQRDPETSPYVVRRRLDDVRRRLATAHVEGRASVLTVDMGGFLWWSDLEVVDWVGLTDVPIAVQSHRRTAMLASYLYEERRPELLVMSREKLDLLGKDEKFDQNYVDVEAMVAVRRDLLFEAGWGGPRSRAAAFEGGLELLGLHVPSPAVPPGGPVFVEVGLRSVEGSLFAARLLLADADGTVVAQWPLAPAYGWVEPSAWSPDEVFHGRYTLDLPPGLAEGRYALGVRLAIEGGPATPTWVADGGEADGEGAVWFADGLRLVGVAEARAEAEADLARALTEAARGACPTAESAWREAVAHVPRDEAFARDGRAGVNTALATCWRDRAAAAPEEAVADLSRAMRLDPGAPGVAEAVATLAAERYASGLVDRRAGRLLRAFRAFSDAVALEPSRAWARRYAEEAREVLLDRERARGRRD